MFKKIFFVFSLSILTANSWAQDLEDNFYVKVLSRELNRNIQRLHLPDLSKPFFISYRLRNNQSFGIRAERGIITSTLKEPSESKTASVKLLVGDYHRNFDYMQFGGFPVSLPREDNSDEIRRLLWLETDRAYKNVAQQYNATLASLKRVTVEEKELALDDLSKIAPLVKDYGAITPVQIERQKWEGMLKELSSIFNKYPELTTSYCQININNYEDYFVSSEGTITRQPSQLVTFSAFASANDNEGNNFNEVYSYYARDISDLPVVETLRSEINKIITSIQNSKQAKKFENAYLGPVLFIGDAVPDLLQNMFGNSLTTRRKSIMGYDYGNNDYEDKLGQKLVSADLTVTALPKLESFNGKSTTGSFQIDDEGVVPPDSLVLIKNGILKSLLNGRTPTQKFPKSQGFVKSSFGGRVLNPGVLMISSSNTIPPDSMKQRLIKIAKEEGLPFAYIVKAKEYSNSDLYRVDVKTGQESLVADCRIANFNIRSLRRFTTASNKQILTNMSNLSIIAPQSLIVNEVEIEKENKTVKPKPIIVSNPLLNKKIAASQKPKAENLLNRW